MEEDDGGIDMQNKTEEQFLRDNDRSGQSMIEFIVGLVAILVLSAGLLQIASLTRAQADVMNESRRIAGEQSLLDMTTLEPAHFIQAMEMGPDNKKYTRDDTFTLADASTFRNTFINRTVENDADWAYISRSGDEHFTQMRNTANPSIVFGMVQGESHQTVDLISAVQSLIYRAPSIRVEGEVWMTRTGEIY